MTDTTDGNSARKTAGLTLHRAFFYDLTVWFFTQGRERAFREKILRLARVQPGESLLDVGCGTGGLAIAAKRLVGRNGSVCGVDASPEMLARAKTKARRAGTKIEWEKAVAQALPFPGAMFDAALSTVMLHHLPRAARQMCVGEMRRVVKPGGRVLIVDFEDSSQPTKGVLSRLHRHGHVKLDRIAGLVDEAGMNIIESGEVGTANLNFVLATTPCGATPPSSMTP